MLREKVGDLPRRGEANGIGAWTMLLRVVEGLAVLDERDEAAKLYSLVLEAFDTGVLMRTYDVRLLETVAGIAAACGQQWEKAEEHYQTALRQAPRTAPSPGAAGGAPLVRAHAHRPRRPRQPRQGPRAAHGSRRHVPRDRHAQARGDGGDDAGGGLGATM